MNPFTAPLRVLTPVCKCHLYHPMAAHDESCPGTPIFAELCEEINSAFGLLHDLTFAAVMRQAYFQRWWNAR